MKVETWRVSNIRDAFNSFRHPHRAFVCTSTKLTEILIKLTELVFAAKLRMLILISMIHLSSAAQPLRECKLSNHSWRFNIVIIPPAQLSVNLDTIAVSGFSSGGCFAAQFHAAFSGTVGSTLPSFSNRNFSGLWCGVLLWLSLPLRI